jgi:signal transduction histidine kinase
MTTLIDAVGEQGLMFFGRTTASVSHELKNALAIIKESAGLLGDYMAMIDKGRPIASDRIKTITDRIEGQVLRSDHLIRSLNRFGHTIDNFAKELDVNEIVDLLAILSRRPAAMRQMTLECRPAPAPVLIVTTPFFLLVALGHCLEFALTLATAGDNIVMGVSEHETADIVLQLPSGFSPAFQAQYPSLDQADLLSRLGAAIDIDPAAGRIAMRLNTK